MALFLSYEDTQRMVDDTVIVYDGALQYVAFVERDLMLTLVDLETGERRKELADFEKIANPKEGRIGYLNSDYGARYIVRCPARVYKMGFAPENLLHIERGHERAIHPVTMGQRLEGLYEAYHNIYPSFEEAYAKAKATERLVAYDRSFAVDKRGAVYYQDHKVGAAARGTEDSIVWTPKGLLASFVRNRPQLNWR